MPLFEYDCLDCGAFLEALVRDSAAPSCPSCGSARLERRLSNFGLVTESTTKSARSKAVQERKRSDTDRIIAERERMDSHQH